MTDARLSLRCMHCGQVTALWNASGAVGYLTTTTETLSDFLTDHALGMDCEHGPYIADRLDEAPGVEVVGLLQWSPDAPRYVSRWTDEERREHEARAGGMTP